eukprot:TRINITY_DN1111_c0_g1_i1.p1 TRINITY_DN1111_c0_g1~~TRINITY_DN1111_c0_g1_i1.p1  ORF type:complete len:1103 (-),score=238.93 TRINITY_DN1111_c0_g1_i1:95-2971(-)
MVSNTSERDIEVRLIYTPSKGGPGTLPSPHITLRPGQEGRYNHFAVRPLPRNGARLSMQIRPRVREGQSALPWESSLVYPLQRDPHQSLAPVHACFASTAPDTPPVSLYATSSIQHTGDHDALEVLHIVLQETEAPPHSLCNLSGRNLFVARVIRRSGQNPTVRQCWVKNGASLMTQGATKVSYLVKETDDKKKKWLHVNVPRDGPGTVTLQHAVVIAESSALLGPHRVMLRSRSDLRASTVGLPVSTPVAPTPVAVSLELGQVRVLAMERLPSEKESRDDPWGQASGLALHMHGLSLSIAAQGSNKSVDGKLQQSHLFLTGPDQRAPTQPRLAPSHPQAGLTFRGSSFRLHIDPLDTLTHIACGDVELSLSAQTVSQVTPVVQALSAVFQEDEILEDILTLSPAPATLAMEMAESAADRTASALYQEDDDGVGGVVVADDDVDDGARVSSARVDRSLYRIGRADAALATSLVDNACDADITADDSSTTSTNPGDDIVDGTDVDDSVVDDDDDDDDDDEEGSEDETLAAAVAQCGDADVITQGTTSPNDDDDAPVLRSSTRRQTTEFADTVVKISWQPSGPASITYVLGRFTTITDFPLHVPGFKVEGDGVGPAIGQRLTHAFVMAAWKRLWTWFDIAPVGVIGKVFYNGIRVIFRALSVPISLGDLVHFFMNPDQYIFQAVGTVLIVVPHWIEAMFILFFNQRLEDLKVGQLPLDPYNPRVRLLLTRLAPFTALRARIGRAVQAVHDWWMSTVLLFAPDLAYRRCYVQVDPPMCVESGLGRSMQSGLPEISDSEDGSIFVCPAPHVKYIIGDKEPTILHDCAITVSPQHIIITDPSGKKVRTWVRLDWMTALQQRISAPQITTSILLSTLHAHDTNSNGIPTPPRWDRGTMIRDCLSALVTIPRDKLVFSIQRHSVMGPAVSTLIVEFDSMYDAFQCSRAVESRCPGLTMQRSLTDT